MGKQILYQGNYIQLCRENHWEYVERVNCTGIVVMIALTTNKEIILVEQYRPAIGKQVLELPAGLVGDTPGKRDETLLAAAHRELLEETGYQTDNFTPCFQAPVSPGLSNELMTVLLARNCQKVGKGGGTGCENITVHTVAIEHITQYLTTFQRRGGCVDIKILAAVTLQAS